MTPEMEALARRAVACKGWRWMPGMRFLTFDAGHRYACRVNESAILGQCIDPLPDLADLTTAGALLQMLTADYLLVTVVSPTGPDDTWDVEVYHHATETTPRIYINVPGATLGEACARALLALCGEVAP